MKNLFYYYLVLILFSLVFAKGIENNQNTFTAMDGRENNSPTISVMNINNIAHWIGKDGAYTTAGSPNGTQGDYPIFTGGNIYADGIVWGAKVKNDGQGNDGDIRVGGSTYGHGLKAGRVITDANGNVLGSDDPNNNHVWRVRKDWSVGDLSADAANFFGHSSPDYATESEIYTIRGQYEYDWMNWPAAWGAPYEDVDGDGTYNPNVDIPGYPGADQTVWIVANDVPLIVDANGDSIGYLNTSYSVAGAGAIGIELQITMWGYAADADQPLGNMLFKKASMKYTGLPGGSANAMMDSVYFSQWSDPDLGVYTDDFVGCDVDLSLGYVYNGNTLDGVFDGIYGMPVPASGFDFLQGPPDTYDLDGDSDQDEYLPMTSFTYFGAGAEIGDPDLGSYSGTLQWYNLMEGFLPRPEYPTQVPYTDYTTGEITKFALSGNPLYGSGWVDGFELPAGDRRMVMSSGPFRMNLGEQIDVVVAILGSQGINNIESVRELKIDDEVAQLAYDTNFDLLNYDFTISETNDQNVNTITLNVRVSENISSVGAVLDNGAFQGTVALENVGTGYYSSDLSISESPQGYSISLILNGGLPIELNRKINNWNPIEIAGDDIIYDNLADNGVLNIDDLAEVALTVYNDSEHDIIGLAAGVYHIEGPVEYITDHGLSFGNIAPNTSVISGAYFETFWDNTDHITLKISEYAEAGDIVTLYLRFNDSNGNIWEHSYDLTIEDGVSDIVDMENIGGSADGSLIYRIVRPADVTGDTYKVSFSEITANSTRSAGKVLDCSGSTVTGYGMLAENGTIDLNFSFTHNCGSNWVDGISFRFPSDMGTVNSWAITGPGNVCSYGTDSGQNCVNMDGTYSDAGDSLIFGTTATGGGFGAFESSNVFTVNYTPASDFAPLTIGFTVYDDSYDGTTVNAVGTFLIDTILEYPLGTVVMNLENMSTNNLILSTDDFPNAEGTNFGIIDGFKIFQGTAIYGTIVDYADYIISGGPCWDPANRPCPPEGSGINGESIFDIASYRQYGWAITAKAVDTYGNGLTSPSILGRDIQIRFVGDFVDFPTTSDNGVVYYGADTTLPHSYAWISGSRLSPLSEHPSPENPGDGSSFRIAVPFEVWDMEAEGGPQQIDIDIYDRMQSYNAGDTVYVFNPYDRMYTHFMHQPYQKDGLYINGPTGIPTDWLTWNVVWWDTQFDRGDVITFEYFTPISTEDEFVFTPSSNTFRKLSANIPHTYELSQNYPNPFNPITNIKYSIPDKSIVSLSIYDILGRQIIQLIDKEIGAGTHNIIWDGKNNAGDYVSTGIYYYKLEADNFVQTRKMILLK